METKPTFGYWSIRGLGQPIRFLLAYLKVDYEEKRYPTGSRDEWFSEKEKLNLDFPNIPYFLDGTTRVTESRAILKYLCRTRKPELLGDGLQAQTDIETVENFMYDLFCLGFVQVCYKYTDELHKQYKEREKLKLGYLNKFLDGRTWVAGDKLTYVDFITYEILRDLRVYCGKFLDAFPNILSYVARFESIPTIKKYMESPEYIESPIFLPHAIIKI